ncbi:hypothetical protein NMY22_g15804 [Coprinellus aureogranulatus]|nr:hypothetical protein NMY22_g15804 [Coprinellus aureogranulatus]
MEYATRLAEVLGGIFLGGSPFLDSRPGPGFYSYWRISHSKDELRGVLTRPDPWLHRAHLPRRITLPVLCGILKELQIMDTIVVCGLTTLYILSVTIGWTLVILFSLSEIRGRSSWVERLDNMDMRSIATLVSRSTLPSTETDLGLLNEGVILRSLPSLRSAEAASLRPATSLGLTGERGCRYSSWHSSPPYWLGGSTSTTPSHHHGAKRPRPRQVRTPPRIMGLTQLLNPSVIVEPAPLLSGCVRNAQQSPNGMKWPRAISPCTNAPQHLFLPFFGGPDDGAGCAMRVGAANKHEKAVDVTGHSQPVRSHTYQYAFPPVPISICRSQIPPCPCFAAEKFKQPPLLPSLTIDAVVTGNIFYEVEGAFTQGVVDFAWAATAMRTSLPSPQARPMSLWLLNPPLRNPRALLSSAFFTVLSWVCRRN